MLLESLLSAKYLVPHLNLALFDMLFAVCSLLHHLFADFVIPPHLLVVD